MKVVKVVLFFLVSSNLFAQNLIQDTGNIGIGTVTPQHKLDIKLSGSGHLKTYDFGMEMTVGTTGGWARGFRLRNENNNKGTIFGSFNGVAYIATGYDVESDPTGYQNIDIAILENGNVGIGTTNPKGYKLGVNGKIAATEVKVASYSNWSDYVFKDGYQLADLSEVEKYINLHGHLPNIPSEQEVAADGFYLAEMDANLLRKIEELTLYSIKQDKVISSLIEELSQQREETERLKEMNQLMLDQINRIINNKSVK